MTHLKIGLVVVVFAQLRTKIVKNAHSVWIRIIISVLQYGSVNIALQLKLQVLSEEELSGVLTLYLLPPHRHVMYRHQAGIHLSKHTCLIKGLG